MKLRNKKTGEIAEANDWNIIQEYNSLAELNKEWEDYKEPKEYWFIDYDGGIIPFSKTKETATDRMMEAIGNYFSTKEEAEKAVEKLKAWKRLRDRYGFAFNGKVTNSKGKFCGVRVKYDNEAVTMKEARQAEHDVAILFGGEE